MTLITCYWIVTFCFLCGLLNCIHSFFFSWLSYDFYIFLFFAYTTYLGQIYYLDSLHMYKSTPETQSVSYICNICVVNTCVIHMFYTCNTPITPHMYYRDSPSTRNYYYESYQRWLYLSTTIACLMWSESTSSEL